MVGLLFNLLKPQVHSLELERKQRKVHKTYLVILVWEAEAKFQNQPGLHTGVLPQTPLMSLD